MTQGERFTRESDRMLRIDVDGGVWLKPGAAIAYRGNIAFERRPTLGGHSPVDAAFRELTPIVRANGTGRMYCGHHGEHVRIVHLKGETIFVVWDELLAFEESLQFEPGMIAHGIGILAGGIVRVKLSGTGSVAIITHGEPLSLEVRPGDSVSTDPHATIAWSGGLTPQLKTDLSWRSIFAHGGQEPIQMYFEGDGYVVVQPYEAPRQLSFDSKSIETLSSLFAG
jgi:uncharacterized protein (AIM24 family)